MKEQQNLHITKLSASIHSVSHDEATKKLVALRQTTTLASDLPLKTAQKIPNKKEQYFQGQYFIHKEIEANLTTLKTIFGKSDDIIFREFIIGIKNQTKTFLCFIDGLSDKKLIDEYVVKPLLVNIHLIDPNETLLAHNMFTRLKNHVFNAVEIREEKEFDEVLDAVLGGNAALFIDGYDTVLIISAKGGEIRTILHLLQGYYACWRFSLP